MVFFMLYTFLVYGNEMAFFLLFGIGLSLEEIVRSRFPDTWLWDEYDVGLDTLNLY